MDIFVSAKVFPWDIRYTWGGSNLNLVGVSPYVYRFQPEKNKTEDL